MKPPQILFTTILLCLTRTTLPVTLKTGAESIADITFSTALPANPSDPMLYYVASTKIYKLDIS